MNCQRGRVEDNEVGCPEQERQEAAQTTLHRSNGPAAAAPMSSLSDVCFEVLISYLRRA